MGYPVIYLGLPTVLSQLDSLEALIEASCNLPPYKGKIYYVSALMGDDRNDGLSPDNAKATIQAAIDTCSAGDRTIVAAGTYNEDVNLDKDAVELWVDIGTLINAQTGVGLTVSGNCCKIVTPVGTLRINPVTNGTGCLISGTGTYIQDVRIPCGSSGGLGFDITGHGSVLTRCRASNPLIAGFKVQANSVHINEGVTRGLTANTSIGYWVTNSCDGVVLRNCASRGHITAGYKIDAGVTNGGALNCSSGGGDGAKIDMDHTFVWSSYTYDNVVAKDITFTGTTTTYNLFKVTGVVRVTDIYGIVETQIGNTASKLHLEAFSAGGAVNITKKPGTNIKNAIAGSALIRN